LRKFLVRDNAVNWRRRLLLGLVAVYHSPVLFRFEHLDLNRVLLLRHAHSNSVPAIQKHRRDVFSNFLRCKIDENYSFVEILTIKVWSDGSNWACLVVAFFQIWVDVVQTIAQQICAFHLSIKSAARLRLNYQIKLCSAFFSVSAWPRRVHVQFLDNLKKK